MNLNSDEDMGVEYILCLIRRCIYDDANTPEEKAKVSKERTNQIHGIYKEYEIN